QTRHLQRDVENTGQPSRSLSSGSTPKMVAESNCRYEVEWVTEYACHRDYLESHSCKLTSEQHDISIDLTPLTLSSTDPPYFFQPPSDDDPDSYIYYLNVCGKIPTGECGNDLFISSCQMKKSGNLQKVAGRFVNQTLRSIAAIHRAQLISGAAMCCTSLLSFREQ
ncbi:hypothetical protein GOODEAATRI_023267, partial [Goodea atripinnis]